MAANANGIEMIYTKDLGVYAGVRMYKVCRKVDGVVQVYYRFWGGLARFSSLEEIQAAALNIK